MESARLSEDRTLRPRLGDYSFTNGPVEFRNERGEIVRQLAQTQGVTVVDSGRFRVGDQIYVKVFCGNAVGYVPDNYIYLKTERSPEYIAQLLGNKEQQPIVDSKTPPNPRAVISPKGSLDDLLEHPSS